MKLYYFDIYGRAEPIRMLLRHAKVDFEDVKFEFPEFKTLKEEKGDKFEFGQVPVLELADGTTFAQSHSILRLLAKMYGPYYPEDPVQAWRVDSALDAGRDVQEKFWDVIMASFKETEGAKEKQEKLLNEYLNKTLTSYFQVMQKLSLIHI